MKLAVTEGFLRAGYMTPASLSPISVEDDEELIKLLEDLGNLTSEYPPELLATRRATFIAQVEQWEKARSTQRPL